MRRAAPGLIVREGSYRLSEDVARRVRSGHPWVFRDALAGRAVGEQTGELVDLTSGNGTFLARGFVDKEHAVAVRVLSRDSKENVRPGSGAIAGRLKKAIQLRWLVLGPERPSAMRLFAGESEGLPGWVRVRGAKCDASEHNCTGYSDPLRACGKTAAGATGRN